MNKFNMIIVASIAFALFFCSSTIQAAPANNTIPETTTMAQIVCPEKEPCGFAVYIPSTKKVDFFLKNKCVCTPDKACVREEDDENAGAYVYRCGIKPGIIAENIVET